MGQYSIKDVEVLSGIKAHTLRVWEKRYDFLKPRRTDTNIRFYDDQQLKLLLNIGTLNRKGFKISRIADMNQKQLSDEILRTSEPSNPDDQTDALVKSLIDFDSDTFENIVDSAVAETGFENAATNLLFPFMIRTGVLWSAGTIRPAQEHFVTNLFRRKIIAAIDNLSTKRNEKSKRYLLFLPEGETHELLLLFTEYLLKRYGQKTVYLGSSVPISDLAFMRDTFMPDALVVYISIATEGLNAIEYFKNISSLFSASKIISGGAQVLEIAHLLPANISVVRSITDLKAAIG